MTPGEYVKKIRESLNLKQEEVAEKINIDRSTLSKYERDELNLPIDIIKSLSEIYNVPVSNIIYAKDLKEAEKEDVIEKLYDDKYKISKKFKSFRRISILLTIILIFIFFVYYFVNTYNSLKVYSIRTDSSNIIIDNGILVQSRKKIILNIGYINSPDEISNIELFYYLDGEKKILCTTSDVNNIYIIDNSRYEEYFTFSRIKDILNNLYIKVNNDDNNIIKLVINKNFTNDELLFSNDIDESINTSNIEHKDSDKTERTIIISNNKYLVIESADSIIVEGEEEMWDYNKTSMILNYVSGKESLIYNKKINSYLSEYKNDEKVKLFDEIINKNK